MKCLGLIGLGMIGGSIAAGLKRVLPETRIAALDVSDEALRYGLKEGLIDDIAPTINDLMQMPDVICLCVPIKQLPSLMPGLAGFSGVVTDVGSVKGPIVRLAEGLWGQLPANWVPAHPIAGSEQHSVLAARHDLFEAHKVILTPGDDVQGSAVELVSNLWQSLGAEVVVMSVAHHDDILAQTSHLPHLLAYTLVDVLAGFGDEREVFEYAAGGFRDFSRIAASDPVMWHDIFLTNKGPLLDRLRTVIEALEVTATLIEQDASEALLERLSRAKSARDYFADLQVQAAKKGQ